MQLHNFSNKNKKNPRPRIGRGGKRGTYSGRGQKGQRSRAGRRIRKAERDLILRLPKRRGFRNKPVSEKPELFNLYDLLKKIKPLLKEKNQIIDIKTLQGAGILPARFKGEVKILAGGNIDVPINLKGFKISKNAKIKIEKAGGKVMDLTQKSESKDE